MLLSQVVFFGGFNEIVTTTGSANPFRNYVIRTFVRPLWWWTS